MALNRSSIHSCELERMLKLVVLQWHGNQYVSLRKRVDWAWRTLVDWNGAAVLRHYWHLFPKTDSLWVAWVKTFLLKGICPILCSCSWNWRSVLKIRDLARHIIYVKVGLGNYFICHDYWHPLGPLYVKFGQRTIYDLT